MIVDSLLYLPLQSSFDFIVELLVGFVMELNQFLALSNERLVILTWLDSAQFPKI